MTVKSRNKFVIVYLVIMKHSHEYYMIQGLIPSSTCIPLQGERREDDVRRHSDLYSRVNPVIYRNLVVVWLGYKVFVVSYPHLLPVRTPGLSRSGFTLKLSSKRRSRLSQELVLLVDRLLHVHTTLVLRESSCVRLVYYESMKRDLKTRPIYDCRCDERLKTKGEGSTRLGYTGLLEELEHLKIETRLIDDMFASVMGEYEFLKS